MYEQVVRSHGRLDVIYNNMGLMDPGDRSALTEAFTVPD
jgi:NAD(P)-dependent dehydrogenase (short-subunit alcohol dehydrogenase family)